MAGAAGAATEVSARAESLANARRMPRSSNPAQRIIADDPWRVLMV
jgi:hypothetical protein